MTDVDEPDNETLVVVGLAELFQEELDAWRRAGRLGIPTLVLPDAPEPTVGRCLSCGDKIVTGRWRCEVCRQAVELVLEQDYDHQGDLDVHHEDHVAKPELRAEVDAEIKSRREPWTMTSATTDLELGAIQLRAGRRREAVAGVNPVTARCPACSTSCYRPGEQQHGPRWRAKMARPRPRQAWAVRDAARLAETSRRREKCQIALMAKDHP